MAHIVLRRAGLLACAWMCGLHAAAAQTVRYVVDPNFTIVAKSPKKFLPPRVTR